MMLHKILWWLWCFSASPLLPLKWCVETVAPLFVFCASRHYGFGSRWTLRSALPPRQLRVRSDGRGEQLGQRREASVRRHSRSTSFIPGNENQFEKKHVFLERQPPRFGKFVGKIYNRNPLGSFLEPTSLLLDGWPPEEDTTRRGRNSLTLWLSFQSSPKSMSWDGLTFFFFRTVMFYGLMASVWPTSRSWWGWW